MRKRRKPGERGNAMVEMAMVFLPLMFSVFSICELGRAMWIYHTLATAVKKGTRIAMVHGDRCAEASVDCPVTVATLVTAIQQGGIGLDPALLQLTFVAGTQTLSCAPSTSCATNSSNWPPAPNNVVGENVSINAKYTFTTVLTSLWPGQSTGTFNLAAKSTEVIQF